MCPPTRLAANVGGRLAIASDDSVALVTIVEVAQLMAPRALGIRTMRADSLECIILAQPQTIFVHGLFTNKILDQGRWQYITGLRAARCEELAVIRPLATEYFSCTIVAIEVFNTGKNADRVGELITADIVFVLGRFGSV
jgi:hypothetical protein